MKISIFYVHIESIATQTGRSIPDILAELKADGIEAIEMDATQLRDNPDIGDMVAAAGLKFSNFYEFFDLGNHPEQDPAITVELALRYGVSNVMIIPGFLEPEEMPVYENDTQMWEEMAKNPKIAHMVTGVRRAVARAKGTDVAVTMEPYGDPLHAPFGRISQLLWFADQIEGLKMTLDTGNFIYTDEDALENAHRLAPMVTHLHCKSYAVDENEPVGRFYRGVAPAAIYEGYIPLWHILDYMEGCGYDGYLVIEEDNMEDHLTAAKNSIRYLKSFINRQK